MKFVRWCANEVWPVVLLAGLLTILIGIPFTALIARYIEWCIELILI